MELKYNPSVNSAHERYKEGERKRVVAIKKKEQKELETKYLTRRIAVGVLGTAAIVGLMIGTKLVDDKLTDNVYRTYGESTGTMRHPITHQLADYWVLDESGKKYYMEDLKFKALFEKRTDKDELATNYTPESNSLLGETEPFKGGK